MKTILKLAAVALSVACFTVAESHASGLLSPATVLDTTVGGTNTIQSFINTNQAWPNNFPAGQSVTNVTRIDVAGSSSITFEMANQLAVTAAASPTNIIYHLGRSISGGTPTNGLVTANPNLKIDWFATITNQLPASAVAGTTYTKLVQFGTQTGYTDGAFEGGCTTFYLGWVDPPANLAVTNSTVRVSVQ